MATKQNPFTWGDLQKQMRLFTDAQYAAPCMASITLGTDPPKNYPVENVLLNQGDPALQILVPE